MTSAERHEVRYQRRVAKRMKRRQAAQATFDDVFTFDHMYRSYQRCCNNVRWKASVQSYSANALVNVRKKQLEILSGREKTMGFVEFDICDRGKQRHIMSCHISDRVSQRTLCDYCMVPQLSRTFIHDNGASMPGKGMDFALDRLDTHLHRHYRAHGVSGYILQMDFSGFFRNISHKTAFEMFDRDILDTRLNEKARTQISMYGDRGVGLGAMPSQVTAVGVPNRLDHFIKEVLRVKAYGRYMDDSYLIHESKEYLAECLRRIRQKCEELEIPISENKTHIRKISHGFTFLKIHYSISPATGAVVRRPNRKAFVRQRRRLRTFRKWVSVGKMRFEEAVASMASWAGCIRRSRCFYKLQSLKRYFYEIFREEIMFSCMKLPKTVRLLPQ
jgi:RNA-directed DNA polymerase